MKKSSLLFLSLTLGALPSVVYAADSNFVRDRNIAVTERLPTEYAPLGIRAGAFTVAPRVDLGVSLNDNIYYVPDREYADTIFSIAPSVGITSNWGRHALNGSLTAVHDGYAKDSSVNTFDWNASVGGRLDIRGNSNAFAGLSVSSNHEPLSDPSRPQSASEPVVYDAAIIDAGFIAEGNRVRFTGKFSFSDLDYKSVRSISGGMINQDGRDYKKAEFSGRGDYAISPDTSAYLLYSSNSRDYELAASTRNSKGYRVAGGTSFDLSNLMRGEVELGYFEQTYKNPAFKKATSASVRAKVEYFPTQLITLTFETDRSVEETPYVLASGYISASTRVRADYELLRNLVLSGSYGQIKDDYNGLDRRDARKDLSLGGKYLVSRKVSLRANYTYSENRSKGFAAIPSYTDNLLRLSLGLQY